MQLNSDDGGLVELSVVGYQFPELQNAEPGDWDANWLVVPKRPRGCPTSDEALVVTAARPQRPTARRGLRSQASGTDPAPRDPATATVLAFRALARRHQRFTVGIDDLDARITPLVETINPTLCALLGFGPDVAGQLLVTAGANPDRLRSEAAFAMLCGTAPLPASSGRRTDRYRLNRGRQANAALDRIVLCRLRW